MICPHICTYDLSIHYLLRENPLSQTGVMLFSQPLTGRHFVQGASVFFETSQHISLDMGVRSESAWVRGCHHLSRRFTYHVHLWNQASYTVADREGKTMSLHFNGMKRSMFHRSRLSTVYPLTHLERVLTLHLCMSHCHICTSTSFFSQTFFFCLLFFILDFFHLASVSVFLPWVHPSCEI